MNKTKEIELKKKMKEMRKTKVDGRLVSAILDSLIDQANRIKKQLNKETKKKIPDNNKIHDLRIESHAYKFLVEEMIKNLVKELTKISLEKAKRKAKREKKHARVGRK